MSISISRRTKLHLFELRCSHLRISISISISTRKTKHVRFYCAYAFAYASVLMRKWEQHKTNKWVPSYVSAYFAYAYVAGVLTWYGYSGAPAARRAAKRSPIIIEKRTTRMHMWHTYAKSAGFENQNNGFKLAKDVLSRYFLDQLVGFY